MSFAESLVFYLVIGIAIAVAHARMETARRPAHALQHLGACIFWPLYLPLLLTRPEGESPSSDYEKVGADALAVAIEQVEQELDAALRSLDGWAEGVLNQRTIRLDELRFALTHQADRIREMEMLLTKERVCPTAAPTNETTGDRSQRSLLARQENMTRLARLCEQARSELMATLAWVRELVSMIHLAKFTGAPAARAEELVAQIAAAVEGIAAVSQPNHHSQTMAGAHS